MVRSPYSLTILRLPDRPTAAFVPPTAPAQPSSHRLSLRIRFRTPVPTLFRSPHFRKELYRLNSRPLT